MNQNRDESAKLFEVGSNICKYFQSSYSGGESNTELRTGRDGA